MRKCLILILTALLLSLPLCVLAEAPDFVFPLVEVTEAGETVIGTAVSADRTGMTLVSASCVMKEQLYAVRGAERIRVTGVMNDWAGLGLGILTLEEPAQGATAPLSECDAASWYGVKADGGELRGEINDPAETVVAEHYVTSVRLDSGVMPGAVLLDAAGGVAGLAVSGVNEGFDRWNVVSGGDLFNLLVSTTYELRVEEP